MPNEIKWPLKDKLLSTVVLNYCVAECVANYGLPLS